MVLMAESLSLETDLVGELLLLVAEISMVVETLSVLVATLLCEVAESLSLVLKIPLLMVVKA